MAGITCTASEVVMFSRRALALSVPLMFAPFAAHAQQHTTHAFGVLGGPIFEHGTPYGVGIQLGSYVTVPVNDEFRVRFEVGYGHFDGPAPTPVGTFDLMAGSPPATTRVAFFKRSNALNLVSGTVNLTFRQPSRRWHGLKWIVGTGVYRLNDTGNGTSYTRAGWNARVSIPLDERVALDVGYHGLVGRSASRGFFPAVLTVGL